ncbi:MAG TPA: glycosyltransferase [Gemmataceae bacterium]|nr:glycosyltransferase [Gemmataceae bacterium]
MTLRASVVVPTFRRPELLGRCLTALLRQRLDAGQFEIVVADDAAEESTRCQVQLLAAATSISLRYIPVTGNHGPAAARNAGWHSCGGEIIAFTDDDTIPDSAWLTQGLAAFERDADVMAVAGQTEVPLPTNPTDYERNESGLAGAEFITANCFVRRRALEEVGGFDERFRSAWREDSDLEFALLERGMKIVNAPSAVVVHPVRPAPWGVCLSMQRKSQYDALLFKKHPEFYRRRIRPGPPRRYYTAVASLLAALVFALAGSQLGSLLAGGVWLLLTGQFTVIRLRRNSLAPAHVAEMILTSAVIPPLSVFWRLYGAAKFRTIFF